jgi:hypothetical protein
MKTRPYTKILIERRIALKTIVYYKVRAEPSWAAFHV